MFLWLQLVTTKNHTFKARYYIPVIQENALKSFWSAELNEAKQASIDAHSLWILCGKAPLWFNKWYEM